MSGPVPTLGYTSKSQAALALSKEGYTHWEIAQKVGTTQNAVGALIASARRAKHNRNLSVEVAVTLDAGTNSALLAAAETRHATTAQIAARLLACAARDGLIDAILDDGGKP